MKVNKTTMVSFIIIVLFFGACLLPSTTGFHSKEQTSQKEIILLRINESHDIRSLQSLHGQILETYDHDVLVEIDSSKIPAIQKKGLSYTSLHHHTTLFINDFVFDFTNGEPTIPPKLRKDAYNAEEKGLYIVHMIGPITQSWRPILERMGIEVLHYIHNYAYLVWMTPEQKNMVLDLYFVDWVGIYHPYYKIQPEITPGMITIGMVADTTMQSLKKIRENTVVFSEAAFEEGYVLIAELFSKETIAMIASINDVLYITEYIEPTLHDEMATQVIGGGLWFFDDEDNNPTTAYRLHGDSGSYMNQIGYTGDGLTIAVADTGIGDGTVGNAGHLDFTGRVVGGYSYQGGWEDGHGHGTHCSGSAAGDTFNGTGSTVYNTYFSGQGSAPESELFAVRIFDSAGNYIGPTDTYHMIQIANQNSDAYVHTNSWGAAVGGSYDSRASRFDAAVRGEDMVVTTSAGNSGPGYNTIGSPATGKNVITVGGSQPYNPNQGYTNPENMYSSSSRGWTDDNRVKPDVIAPAQFIYSTMPGGGYGYMSGTSMSNPAVAGAAAVTVQWYEENHGCRPSPAMVKALLINTANQMGGNTEGPIPNRDEGWGMVDISKLERPLGDPVPFYLSDQEHIFNASGQLQQHLVITNRSGLPLKFSLVWTDKEAPSDTGSGRTLINDLHLEVESPSGLLYRGNAFSNGWTVAGANTMSIFDYSGDGWDDTNNVENVYIHPDDVEIGIYTVRIKADGIAGDGVNVGYNSQDYALVVYNAMEVPAGDPPLVTITAPTGDEQWYAKTVEQITWTATGGDDPIDYINLLYSANSGSTWEIIETNLPNTGTYSWNVPNENSSQCLVKVCAVDIMGRIGENISNRVFTIIGVPPEPPENLTVQQIDTTIHLLFDDDVEGGNLGYITGTSHSQASTWDIRQHGAFSPVNAWDFGDGLFNKQPSGGQGMLSWLISPEIVIPASACLDHGIWFTFQHWRDWGDTSLYDAGNVKISTDGPSGPWTLITPEGGYDGTVPSSWGNPLAGELAWGGSSDWVLASFNLTSYIGESIHIRWDAGVEAWDDLYGEGWRIDDIYIDALVTGEDDDHNLLTWDASADEAFDEIASYNIYRSEYQSGPWNESSFIADVAAEGLSSYDYVDIGKGMADDIIWWYVVRAVATNGIEELNTNAVPEPSDTPMHTLAINSSSGGEVLTPGEGIFMYEYGSVVDLAAEPDIGYHFEEWTGDNDTIANPYSATTTITIYNNYSITAVFTEEEPPNEPPIFGIPTPANESTANPLSFTWSIHISDPEGDNFDWTIECSNSQTTSGTGESNGTKSLELSDLTPSTTYIIWVNATDPDGSTLYTRAWYTFTTQLNTPPNKPDTPTGITSGKTNTLYSYTTSTSDADGDDLYYMWDWDDGTYSLWLGPYESGIDCTADYSWQQSGVYEIRVKAKDIWGYESDWSDSLELTITENIAPTAEFILQPEHPTIDELIQFTDLSTDPDGYLVNWTWDFGDGNTSYLQHPTHQYIIPGNYTVCLTVMDNDGDIDTSCQMLHVTDGMIWLTIPIEEGWNIISIPNNETVLKQYFTVLYNGSEYTWIDAVDNTIITNFIYAWDAIYQTYSLTDLLQPGEGYWLYAYESCTLTFLTTNSEDTSITDASSGWNLIGLPFNTSLAKQNITVSYNGINYLWNDAVTQGIITNFLYGWDTENNSYHFNTDILHPGYGYWLYAYYPCILLKE